MTSTSKTTRTLRYKLWSREIYIEECTPITSSEVLSEPPQMQDDSTNTIQQTPKSQFRLILSVTPWMPQIALGEDTIYVNYASLASTNFFQWLLSWLLHKWTVTNLSSGNNLLTFDWSLEHSVETSASYFLSSSWVTDNLLFSLISVTRSPFPLLFSPTPTSSPAHPPTPDSP